MQLKIVRPPSSDVTGLVADLAEFLRQLNEQGDGHFDVELSNTDRDAFVVLRLDSKPVACGTIRFIDANTCEIKRMFSKQQGMEEEILYILENKAQVLGYTKAILSTRKNNVDAIRLYRQHGYQIIRPFGKYRQSTQSICLGKPLAVAF